ncbi:MAG: carbonic anhydrase family protein [Pseudomonadota bacterium]
MRRAITILLLTFMVQQAVARNTGARSGGMPGDAGQWSYAGETGPAHWASLSEAFSQCGTGRHQSPVDINIRETQQTPLPPLNFHYRTSILSIDREGGRLWIDYDSGSYLKIRGNRYKLRGFDFHTPGEHSFNGNLADMEIHLYHLDSQGNRLIVAIPVIGGHRNNFTLSRIWENIPKRSGNRHYRQVGINPMFLLPSDRSYAFYSGSETKPPCVENVQWVVFTNPLNVSKSDISRFRDIVGSNARPIQPLNGRIVLQDSH